MALDSRLSTNASINHALAAYANGPQDQSTHADKRESCQYTAAERDQDTGRVAKALREHGYTAAAVQQTFAYSPPAHHLPTPGPFYLRKRVDHRSASALPSHAPASGYEVLVRLFLIGVCVEGNLVEKFLGGECVGALKRLGLLCASPLASWQLQSFVQLYPLSLVPALATAGLEGEGADSDLILATDWPPPLSCALDEEPVMYIGSDSLGLVRMAAVCLKLLGLRPTTQDLSHSLTTTREGDGEGEGKGEGNGDATQEGNGDVLASRRLLDLCTGSGVQALALAKMCLLQNLSIQVPFTPSSPTFLKAQLSFFLSFAPPPSPPPSPSLPPPLPPPPL